MSQLSDLIANYPPAKLAAELTTNSDFRILNLLWSDPEQLIPMVNTMGWTTVDDVISWVQQVNSAIGNTEAFVKLCNPEPGVSYDGLHQVPFSAIREALIQQCLIRSDAWIDQADASYRLPSRSQLQSLAMANPYRTKKWVAEKHDCDDFVRAFLGWLASHGLGNLAIGFCTQTPFRNGEMIGGHATAIAMDSDNKIWIIEPQGGLLFEPKSVSAARLGGYWTADSMQLARVYF